MPPIDQKTSGFPEELRAGVVALSDHTREKILFTLMIGDRSYTQLRNPLKVRKGSLTHHLKVLMKAGLVRNFSKGKFSGPYDSFYAITDFGRDLIQGVNGAFEPMVSTVPPFPQTATTVNSVLDELVLLGALRWKMADKIYWHHMLTVRKDELDAWQRFSLATQIATGVDVLTADSGWTVGQDTRIAPLLKAV
jgi:DNA-binding transcriptional ArsR family regulator